LNTPTPTPWYAIHLLCVVLPHPQTVAVTPRNEPSVDSARLIGRMLSEITKTYGLMQNVKELFLYRVSNELR
jgi:hypothetical protein